MPLHRIFHPVGAYSAEEKQQLSDRITDLYVSRGLPPFYVVVVFVEVQKESFYVGGKATDQFIRVVVQHLARQYADLESKMLFSEAYEKVLAPFTKEKGYDWEVHVEEVPPEMWRENGLTPPAPGTPAEQEWARLNKPVPFEGRSFLDL